MLAVQQVGIETGCSAIHGQQLGHVGRCVGRRGASAPKVRCAPWPASVAPVPPFATASVPASVIVPEPVTRPA